jgi:hypothetical protein
MNIAALRFRTSAFMDSGLRRNDEYAPGIYMLDGGKRA